MAQSSAGLNILSNDVTIGGANVSAFGDLVTAENTPVIQGDFVYGLNTQMWNTAVVSGTGATVDTNSGRLRVQSGTDAVGYAYLQTRRAIKYRAGQGLTARYTPIFTGNAANSLQLMGVGSIASNVVTDGYFFGYSGTSFGIFHYVRSVQTFTAQSAWNNDKCDGTGPSGFNWNPAFGSPVMIRYPYLGYGDIKFYVQNPTTGDWILCHVIRYANTVDTTQLANPNLQFTAFTLNSGNTSNLTMYCGSFAVFLSGPRSFASSPKWAMDNNKSSITAETCVLNLRNATTYNGIPNRSLIRVNSLSFATGDAAANTISILRVRIGATIGGSPSYTTINGTTGDGGVTITSGNSIASYDTAGTTASGGTLVYNIAVSSPGNAIIDVTPFDITIAPGETATFSVFSNNSVTAGLALNWSEDI